VPRGKASWNANGGFVSVLLTHLFFYYFTIAFFRLFYLYYTLSLLLCILSKFLNEQNMNE